MTGGYIPLVCWSAIAALWWLICVLLIIAGPRGRHPKAALSPTSLTVFKSIPPLRNDDERRALAEALESFVSQLDHDEIIIGVDEDELAEWQSIFDGWRTQQPEAQIKIVAQPPPVQRANPKVAWMEILSARATGEFWLWSDADVIAPPGFLQKMKNALNADDVNAVTAAYAIRHVRKAAGTLDALFVNAEILPGALLLGRLNAKDFAYGAAIIFRAARFRERVVWADLGSELADDHELGRRLNPVALSETIVSTFTLPESWRDALEHYYRWQKTVRWCRPGGFAATIVVIPMIGWVGGIVLGSGNQVAVIGFVCQWSFEILVGTVICTVVGCRMNPRMWVGLLLWPVVRAAAWLGVWLPVRVIWSGRMKAWSSPRRTT